MGPRGLESLYCRTHLCGADPSRRKRVASYGFTFGEVVMLTVPLAAVPQLARSIAPALEGKVVLDTGNAYERRDGDTARGVELSARLCRLRRGERGPR